jgi:hypothetical protein
MRAGRRSLPPARGPALRYDDTRGGGLRAAPTPEYRAQHVRHDHRQGRQHRRPRGAAVGADGALVLRRRPARRVGHELQVPLVGRRVQRAQPLPHVGYRLRRLRRREGHEHAGLGLRRRRGPLHKGGQQPDAPLRGPQHHRDPPTHQNRQPPLPAAHCEPRQFNDDGQGAQPGHLRPIRRGHAGLPRPRGRQDRRGEHTRSAILPTNLCTVLP